MQAGDLALRETALANGRDQRWELRSGNQRLSTPGVVLGKLSIKIALLRRHDLGGSPGGRHQMQQGPKQLNACPLADSTGSDIGLEELLALWRIEPGFDGEARQVPGGFAHGGVLPVNERQAPQALQKIGG